MEGGEPRKRVVQAVACMLLALGSAQNSKLAPSRNSAALSGWLALIPSSPAAGVLLVKIQALLYSSF